MTQEQHQAYIDAIEYAETPEEQKQAIIDLLKARPALHALMSAIISADDNGETERACYELVKPHQVTKIS